MKKLIFIFLLSSSWAFAQDFSEVASSMGIVGNFGEANFGGGISFCDFDGDGDDDLTFGSKTGDLIHFFRNDGTSFTKIFPVGINHNGISKQVLWADIDNDGDKDFFVATQFGQNKLYENNGSFIFTDVTISAGIPSQNDVTYGACFGDYDNDGWLDLYIINYGINGVFEFENIMLHNDGDGTFTDETASTQTSNTDTIPDFCAIFFDYNGDGNQDLYLATDRYQFENTMFKNNGNGAFSKTSASTNTDLKIDAMNSGAGDYDNDGDLDIYVTNTPGGNVLLRNNGDETFTDVAASSGTLFNRLGWGANFFDFDNDLDLDLYVSAMHTDKLFPNAMYVNSGAGIFTEPLNATGGLGGADTLPSLCNTIGDFNDDGRLDIAVSNNMTFDFLLWENQNTNGTGNHYIKVALEGSIANRDGIGTMVEIYISGKKYIRYKHCGEGYLGQTSDKLHFGLGTATTIDSMIVRWLSGNIDKYYNITQVDQTLNIAEAAALPIQLTNFSGKYQEGGFVKLDWTTNSEVDFFGFELQRSLTGLQYETIHVEEGRGDVSSATSYTFNDDQVRKGNRYYYRLKMMDMDRSFEYSQVVTVTLKKEALFSLINVFPNPAQKNIFANYYLEKSQNIQISVIDAEGKQILGELKELTSGSGVFEINIENLPFGNYRLLVDGNFPRKQLPFLVTNKK